VRAVTHNYYSFKVIEVGDSTVGKTAMKIHFTDEYFKKNLRTTLGVDFGSKELQCEYFPNDVLYKGTYKFTAKISVWDVAGQDFFQKYRGMYYRDSKGVLLIYDINNYLSFQNLTQWLEELDENMVGNLPILLVGNKMDLERKVPREEAEEFAKKHNFLFIETSAKTGENIQEAFKKLAVEIYKREEEIK
jgi:small GTP-binding protein